jgi:mannose-6-phosphate isomerase-like protein (cupin superfamily)
MKKHIKKPWGDFEQFTLNENSTIKILNIKPNQQLSLQSHKLRKEFWKILQGNCLVVIGNKKIRAKEGDEFLIKTGQKHRCKAYKKPVRILEISFGKFNEKDITRIQDDYNRV